LGPVFAAISLLQAASYEVAGRLADRIGLINTMVFTHLPSNLLLLLVPLSPTLEVAVILLFARFATSQMDAPARQAYVVSIVPSAERAGAVAATGGPSWRRPGLGSGHCRLRDPGGRLSASLYSWAGVSRSSMTWPFTWRSELGERSTRPSPASCKGCICGGPPLAATVDSSRERTA